MSGGRLNKSDLERLMEHYHVIKPEFQPILVVMFDTDYLEHKSQKKGGC